MSTGDLELSVFPRGIFGLLEMFPGQFLPVGRRGNGSCAKTNCFIPPSQEGPQARSGWKILLAKPEKYLLHPVLLEFRGSSDPPDFLRVPSRHVAIEKQQKY